ncbi:MAG TPA: sigma 54-interacting transcriptional regulator [Polyangiaceae bacterium]|nr:sigma 54-interacting transcriptional regulator [Polyangiaceae bacterium]
MSGSGNTTSPSSTDDLSYRVPLVRFAFALVLIWSRYEPRRVGQIAILDPEIASAWLLGRGADTPNDSAKRVRLGRQTPTGLVDGGPLIGETMSQQQARIELVAGGIAVRTLGKAVVSIGGQPLSDDAVARMAPGTFLHVRGHSTFLLVHRGVLLPPVAPEVCAHVFGEPDSAGIVGESPGAVTMRNQILRGVRTRGHLLLHGPTGSGKLLAARLVQQLSGRKGRLVRFNMANLTESLADAILFGNVKNYPNPGMHETAGLVFEAEGGVLFLDEFGELPPKLQSKLLLAMEGVATRLGESRERKVDLLVVGATNAPLSQVKLDVRERFTTIIELPSLADRVEDMPLIARALVLEAAREGSDLAPRFVRRDASGWPYVAFAPAMVQAMVRSRYDGNARALRNLLFQAMNESFDAATAENAIRAGKGEPLIDMNVLTLSPPSNLDPWRTPPSMVPPGPEDGVPVDDLIAGIGVDPKPGLSEEHVRKALEKSLGNRGKAAKALGISRHQLYRLMKDLGIVEPEKPEEP